MKVIDTHVHFWDFSDRASFPNRSTEPSFGWPTPDLKCLFRDIPPSEAEEEATKAGVQHGVFVQCLNDSPEEAKWVARMAKKHPFIKGIVGGLSLTDHERLNKCLVELESTKLLVGVRHILDFEDNDFLLREDVQGGLKILSDRGIVFDMLLRPPTLKHVPTIAKKFPELKCIINHIAKPYMTKGTDETKSWKEDMTNAAKFPNVYCKLSGMVTECDPGKYETPWTKQTIEPFAVHCLKVFGPRRCVFGSDWPVCKLAPAEYVDVLKVLVEILDDNCTDEEKEDILFNNANKLYGLNL